METPKKIFMCGVIELLEKWGAEKTAEGFVPTVDLLVEELKEQI